MKNAFALLGKQRFEHAAAFFLLAGALRDAIEVRANRFICLIIFSISLCGKKFLFDIKFLENSLRKLKVGAVFFNIYLLFFAIFVGC